MCAAAVQMRAEQINIGEPFDEGSRMGPLINKQQYDKVLGYIEVGGCCRALCVSHSRGLISQRKIQGGKSWSNWSPDDSPLRMSVRCRKPRRRAARC